MTNQFRIASSKAREQRRQGIEAETCWKDPANADKVPDWLKKKKAKNNADGGTETGLAQRWNFYSPDNLKFA
jgi:hypothetical protein